MPPRPLRDRRHFLSARPSFFTVQTLASCVQLGHLCIPSPTAVRLLSSIAFSLCALAFHLHAEPIHPPVPRTLTDEFERTMDTRIVGVTSELIEVIRVADDARFSIPLRKLSEADRAFAAALLKKAIDSRPLPDTPMLKAVRRDFQIFDAAKKRLVPLEADAYSTTRIFVIAQNYLYETESPFVSRSRMRNERDAALPDQAPVLWILLNGEAALFQLAAEKLPEGHALISYDAREAVVKKQQGIYADFVNAWFGRNRSDPFANQAFNPSEKERADLGVKLKKVVPPYWPDFNAYGVGTSTSRQYPWFKAVHRDGTPVRFRDAELSGSLKVVMTVLRDHASELE